MRNEKPVAMDTDIWKGLKAVYTKHRLDKTEPDEKEKDMKVWNISVTLADHKQLPECTCPLLFVEKQTTERLQWRT